MRKERQNFGQTLRFSVKKEDLKIRSLTALKWGFTFTIAGGTCILVAGRLNIFATELGTLLPQVVSVVDKAVWLTLIMIDFG